MKMSINTEGALSINAESPAEVKETINHFKIDVFSLPVEALGAGSMTHILPPGRYATSRDAEWFEVEYTVPLEFVLPYFERLHKITGFIRPIPLIDPAARYGSPYNYNLCHTHFVDRASISSEGYYFHGFKEGHTWNGQTPIDYAHRLFREYVTAGLGHTQHEPEYLQMGNGLFKHNPNYMKRHAPTPRAESSSVWSYIWDWWVATHATQAQKEVLEAALKCHQTVSKRESLAEYLHRSYDNGFRLSWDTSLMPYQEFQALS